MAAVTTLFFDRLLLPAGWAEQVRLTLANGIITGIAIHSAALPGEERHSIGLPGLANLHSHAFQRGMAGLAERRGPSNDSFWTWRKTMYRFVDRLTPQDLQAIAALAYVEMLESGFTRVGEFHYLHHDRDGTAFADPATMSSAIMEAARDSGIALTHLPVFYAHSGFGGAAPTQGQRRFIHDLDGFARLLDALRPMLGDLPDAVLGIASHSLRAVTPDELDGLVALASTGPIHIHIAEQTGEIEDCLAWSGARPVAWLLDHAPVDARWCLVHATHLAGDETLRLAQSGAVAGLCPITEANLGDGLFPMEAFLQAGGHYGLGSDSNVRIDASEEMRLLEYGQRLAHRGRNLLATVQQPHCGMAIFAAAQAGGAAALGVQGAGGIAVGCPADLVSLDGGHPSLLGRSAESAIDSWVFAAGRGAVDCVWRRGKKLVSSGRHLSRPAILESYRAAMARLIARD